MGTKRIINMNATTDFESDDNIVVDSTTAGTRKMAQSVLKEKLREDCLAGIHNLTPETDFATGDTIVVDNATDGPRGMDKDVLLAKTAQNTLGSIKNLPTSISAFRTGDVIPVDGPDGTAKMPKDVLLDITARNSAEKFSHYITTLYVRGSIGSDGTNTSSDDSLRSGYIPSDKKILVVPPPGYYVRLVVYYSDALNPPEPSAFDSMEIFDYDENNVCQFAGGTSNYFRIVFKTIDGSDSDAGDADEANYIFSDTYNKRLKEFAENFSIFKDFIYSVGEVPAFAQGSISVYDGSNISQDDSLRSQYIEGSEKVVIIPPSGYYVSAICYYSKATFPPSGYISADVLAYSSNANYCLVDTANNYYRVVLSKIDESTADPQDAADTAMVAKTCFAGVLCSGIFETGKALYDTRIAPVFVQGSIDVSNGTNAAQSSSLRSGFVPISEESVIIPPAGYFVREICYYNKNNFTPPDFYNSYDFFEYATSKNFAYTKNIGNYYRVVLKKIDGSDSDVDDAANTIFVKSSCIAGELLKNSFDIYDISKSIPTKGMKLVVTGDSIPHGQVVDGTPPSSPYPVIVANALGMNLKNYAIGGSTFAQDANFGGLYASYADFVADADKDTSKIYVVMTGQQSYTDYAYSDGAWTSTTVQERTPISARYQLMDDDADIVLVAAGTNDFQYEWTPIGTMADRTPDTFYGALHYTILGLLDKYLGKQIIFCTPIKRCQSPYTSVDSVNANGKTLEDYGQIIKEVCAYYSIPVIDLYSESGLNPQVASQSSLFDSYKTHPYQKGHDMIARVVSGKIKSLRGSSF